MIRLLSLVVAAVFVFACSADAQVLSLNWHRGGGNPIVYTGPLDVSGANFTAWYGLRAGSTAIANAATQKLIKVRNTATNETCDIIVASVGGMGNVANCSGSSGGLAPNVFCTLSGATNCAVVTWYDQTGNGHDMTQATTANQPTLLLAGGPTSLPTAQFTGLQILNSANFSPNSSRISSYSTVAKTVTPSAESDFITENGNNGIFGAPAGGAWWCSTSGGGTIVGTASNAFHAGNCLINANGSTSFLYIDTTQNTSTALTGNLATNPIDMSGDQTTGVTVVDVSEGGVADNVLWTTTVALSVQANQKAYWGTP